MYDLQWRKFSVLPKEGQKIFIHDTPRTFADTEAGIRSTTFSQKMLDYNPLFYGYVWCDAEPVIHAPEGYDPTFGDGRVCLCGHPYYRHFDPYEEWAPVGCKYCHWSEEGIEYRKEVRIEPPPELYDTPGDYSTLNLEAFDAWYKENKQPPSICSGFKEDTSIKVVATQNEEW